MHALFAAFQGAGCGAAIGVRPFLPALLVGALASADLGVDYDGTTFSFLESPWFLLVLVVAVGITTFLRRFFDAGPGAIGVQVIAVALAAVEAGAMLDDVDDTWWPGLVVGALAAILGLLAARSLLGRVSARLDAEAAGTLFLYADAFALLAAGISVAFEPLGIVVLAFLMFLLRGGKRREGQKFAGLRILR